MGEDTLKSVKAVDCHAHISNAEFESDRDSVVKECADRGILVVDSALSIRELETSLKMGDASHWVKTTAGWEARNLDQEGALEMVRLIEDNQENIEAVGEVGLDRYWVRDRALWAKQEKIFRMFIELADKLEKPLVVHSRSAGQACIEILLSCGFNNVLMHAFDGSAGNALVAAEKGFLFSIPPSIVRSEQKKKLVRRLELKNLVLESDSPVLGPEKGVRNVPANVFVSSSMIAQIKGLAHDKVLQDTRETSLRFFRLRGGMV
ncbi:MAG: TatD family hydrolase [Thermoprotei archaeon]